MTQAVGLVVADSDGGRRRRAPLAARAPLRGRAVVVFAESRPEPDDDGLTDPLYPGAPPHWRRCRATGQALLVPPPDEAGDGAVVVLAAPADRLPDPSGLPPLLDDDDRSSGSCPVAVRVPRRGPGGACRLVDLAAAAARSASADPARPVALMLPRIAAAAARGVGTALAVGLDEGWTGETPGPAAAVAVPVKALPDPLSLAACLVSLCEVGRLGQVSGSPAASCSIRPPPSPPPPPSLSPVVLAPPRARSRGVDPRRRGGG